VRAPSLYGNDIGAEGAQALKGLVNLTGLNLYGNRIGAEGAQALKGLTALTSQRVLDNRRNESWYGSKPRANP
jgi:hypothetical protein